MHVYNLLRVLLFVEFPVRVVDNHELGQFEIIKGKRFLCVYFLAQNQRLKVDVLMLNLDIHQRQILVLIIFLNNGADLLLIVLGVDLIELSYKGRLHLLVVDCGQALIEDGGLNRAILLVFIVELSIGPKQEPIHGADVLHFKNERQFEHYNVGILPVVMIFEQSIQKDFH